MKSFVFGDPIETICIVDELWLQDVGKVYREKGKQSSLVRLDLILLEAEENRGEVQVGMDDLSFDQLLDP